MTVKHAEEAENRKQPYWRRGRDLFEEDPTIDTGPSDEEVEEWAARERQRRAAWAGGPTEEEKMAWSLREHQRRVSRHLDGGDDRSRRRSRIDDSDDRPEWRDWTPSPRELELAFYGMWDRLVDWTRAWDDLLDAGRDREDDILRYRRRRRVRYGDNG